MWSLSQLESWDTLKKEREREREREVHVLRHLEIENYIFSSWQRGTIIVVWTIGLKKEEDRPNLSMFTCVCIEIHLRGKEKYEYWETLKLIITYFPLC